MGVRWIVGAVLALSVVTITIAADPPPQGHTPPPLSSADEPFATVTIDPPQARIGDRIRVTARSGPGAVGGGAPGLTVDQKLGPFRVLDVSASGDAVVVTVTPQETGDLELPEFEVVFHSGPSPSAASLPGAAGAPHEAGAVPAPAAVSGERRLRVPASRIAVRSVLGEGDATTLADLKPPADFATVWPWKTILASALGLAALIAAAVWLVRRLRRPRQPWPKPEQELPPGVTPDAWAREALARLLAKGLVEAGRLREFHIELADLLRRYVELRFRVPALERTTEEITDELARALVGGEESALAAGALEACDRVKFAKHRPSSEEVLETTERFRQLVERTAVGPASSSGGYPSAAVMDGLTRPDPA